MVSIEKSLIASMPDFNEKVIDTFLTKNEHRIGLIERNNFHKNLPYELIGYCFQQISSKCPEYQLIFATSRH